MQMQHKGSALLDTYKKLIFVVILLLSIFCFTYEMQKYKQNVSSPQIWYQWGVKKMASMQK